MSNKDQAVEYLQQNIAHNIFSIDNYDILKLISELIAESIG